MNLANRFNSLLHLALVLGVLAFVTADAKPLLAILALSALLASWLLSRGARVDSPPSLPRGAINILVLAAIVNATVRAMGNSLNEEFVSTLGQFLVFVMLIKTLDRRAPRDDAQLITLTVFIAVASVLTSNSFVVGVVLMFFVPSAVGAAMMWQLRAGQVMLASAARENAPPGETTAGAPAPQPNLAAGRSPRLAFATVCLSSVLASVAIATAVFVFVPRGFGSDFLGRFGIAHQPQIGFREAVRLGESGFLSDNPTPVMDIRVSTAGGEVLGGHGEMQYFRGAARDQYDPVAHVWLDSSIVTGREPHSRTPTDTLNARYKWTPHMTGMPAPRPASMDSPRSAYTRVQTITVRADSVGGNMFSLWRPVAVTPDRTVEVAFSAANGTMRHVNSPGPAFSYTVDSTISDELCAPPDRPSDFQTGRIHDLAADVLSRARITPVSQTQTSRQAILSIRDFLRAGYGYTTEMVAPPDDQDPIEFFLFDRKKGHCEYFASAMAAMCQSAGIPSRVITGYVASEFNTLTGQYLVRESNAHAWVEVFVAVEPDTGKGRWEVFDASPPGDIERLHRPAGGMFASLRSWYDALEFGWSNTVVGFDNSTTQKQRADSPGPDSLLAARLTRAADRIASWIKTVRADPSLLVATWLRFAPFALLALVAIWIAIRRAGGGFGGGRTRNRARAAHGLSPFRPTGFYARALRALTKAGISKPDHTPPARFADALQSRSPEAAALFRDIVDAFYRSRFGGRTLAPAENTAAEELVRRMESALRARPTQARR